MRLFYTSYLTSEKDFVLASYQDVDNNGNWRNTGLIHGTDEKPYIRVLDMNEGVIKRGGDST